MRAERSWLTDSPIGVDSHDFGDGRQGAVDFFQRAVLIELDGESVEEAGIGKLSLDFVVDFQVDCPLVELIVRAFLERSVVLELDDER